jgi:hypothetical protein
LATHRSQSRAGEQSGRGCFVKIACGRSRGPSPALAALRTREEEERALRLVISRFEDFAQAVATGLAEADLERKRMILHALVKRVEIDDEVIRVVFRVSPPTRPVTTHPVCTIGRTWLRRPAMWMSTKLKRRSA